LLSSSLYWKGVCIGLQSCFVALNKNRSTGVLFQMIDEFELTGRGQADAG
jgi:hypothetical protein